MKSIKKLRRTIIVICSIIIALHVFLSIPKGKYFHDNLRDLVKSNKAEVLEVGKSLKLDNDKILIKRIIICEDEIHIRYAYVAHEEGWSFSGISLKIYDDNGNLYESQSASSTGRSWGSDGLITVDNDRKTQSLTLKIDHYDRHSELTVPLIKEGDSNED